MQKAHWCKDHETAALPPVLNLLEDPFLIEDISILDSVAHGIWIGGVCDTVNTIRSYAVGIADRLPAEVEPHFTELVQEWAGLRRMLNGARHTGPGCGDCHWVERFFNAMDDMTIEMKARLVSRRTEPGDLIELHKRFLNPDLTPDFSDAKAVALVVKGCSEPAGLLPFCGYFLDFWENRLQIPLEYKFGQNIPIEARISYHDIDILWALTEKLPNEVMQSANKWKEICKNKHLLVNVVSYWMVRFGSTHEAFWAVDSLISSLGDLGERLYGMVDRVERGQTTLRELIPKLREWGRHPRDFVREAVVWSTKTLWSLPATSDADRQELSSLLCSIAEDSKANPEGNLYVIHALADASQFTTGLSTPKQMAEVMNAQFNYLTRDSGRIDDEVLQTWLGHFALAAMPDFVSDIAVDSNATSEEQVKVIGQAVLESLCDYFMQIHVQRGVTASAKTIRDHVIDPWLRDMHNTGEPDIRLLRELMEDAANSA